MASKKTSSTKQKVTKKAPKKASTAKKGPKTAKTASEERPRHPKGRVTKEHGGKEALAKSLAKSLARSDEDSGLIADRLKTASNSQLLRLQTAVETMKTKYGSRDKLVAAVAGAQGKDKDYAAKLDKLSLPNLLDLARTAERRARA